MKLDGNNFLVCCSGARVAQTIAFCGLRLQGFSTLVCIDQVESVRRKKHLTIKIGSPFTEKYNLKEVPVSASAATGTLARGARFYGSSIGKKAVMAVTGVILFGFLIGHMAGNLQFFAGPEKINGYAESLRELGPLLWLARIGLLVAVLLHITASIQLVRLQQEARPVSYAKRSNAGSTYASRTMYWSGPIVLAFLIYHLMHLTLGIGGLPFEELRPYENMIAGFSNPLVTIAYLVAIVLLAMHLYHGLWSMFQSLGFNHPRYTPRLKLFARAFTILLVLGFISVPLAILAGVRPAGTML